MHMPKELAYALVCMPHHTTTANRVELLRSTRQRQAVVVNVKKVDLDDQ